MIDAAASLIKDELNAYFQLVLGVADKQVVLGNISNLGEPDYIFLNNKIVITNVIIEEESSLKNSRNYQQSSSGSKDYIEPPVFLNLYFLFCATPEVSPDGYETALQRISLVIQFFQAKNTFNINNSPFSTIANTDTISNTEKSEINIRAELYTLTFEQSNHLWGSLGGKQSPYVMYKIRLVKIQERILQEAPLIEEIHEHGNVL